MTEHCRDNPSIIFLAPEKLSDFIKIIKATDGLSYNMMYGELRRPSRQLITLYIMRDHKLVGIIRSTHRHDPCYVIIGVVGQLVRTFRYRGNSLTADLLLNELTVPMDEKNLIEIRYDELNSHGFGVDCRLLVQYDGELTSDAIIPSSPAVFNNRWSAFYHKEEEIPEANNKLNRLCSILGEDTRHHNERNR